MHERFPVVIHDQPATGLDLRVEPLDRGFGAGRVLNDTQTNHDVIGPRKERQCVDVALDHSMPFGLRTVSLIGMHCRAEICGGDEGRGLFEEPLREPPRSTTRLEHAEVLEPAEPLPKRLTDTAPQSVPGDCGSSVRVKLRDSVLVPLLSEGVGVARAARDDSGNAPLNREGMTPHTRKDPCP